jgi:hypothetical protein
MLLEDERSNKQILNRSFNNALLKDAVDKKHEEIVVMLLQYGRGNPEIRKDEILEMSISCSEIFQTLPQNWLSAVAKFERWQVN